MRILKRHSNYSACQTNSLLMTLITVVMVIITDNAALINSARAQDICETKLNASDGQINEEYHFGYCVAVSGDVAVVGAFGDDENGTKSGSAYIYRYDGTSWLEETKVLASDGALDDYFGYSVSISGDVVVIGAPRDDDNGFYSGSAYIYRYNGTGWTEEAKLTASDGAYNDTFGYSVSISGDAAVIGADGNDENGYNSGAAYIYRYNGSGWNEETKIMASDGLDGDKFGWAVSISRDTAVVGAAEDENNGYLTGSAYIYRYDGTDWVEETKILPSDVAYNDYFGKAVSISGDVAVISSYKDDDNGHDTGSAYIYRYNGTDWIEESKLLASDGEGRNLFGISVSISISGDVAVIGASGEYKNELYTGAAYIYRYNGTGWTEEAKLVASDGEIDDYFGYSVAVSGDMTVIGAYGDHDYGDRTGTAYIYDFICNDSPLLTISPYPLKAGRSATFTVVNAKPNTKTYLAYSLHGIGYTYVPYLNITLDLESPTRKKGMRKTYATGFTTVDLYIPKGVAGRNVWFQACQYELKTNVVGASIE